jgi:hypothetical protein
MSISKKIRFEVFKRDGFKCVYCGKSPPDCILELDHINPISQGGEDDINNLIAACFDCNRGKTNIPLQKIPPTLQDNLEILKEKEIQLKEYNRYLQKIRNRRFKEMEEINSIYSETFKEWTLSEHFYTTTLKPFFEHLPKIEIVEAMRISCSRISDKDNVIKYFCGICWNKIKSKTDPTYKIKKQLIGVWKSQPRGSGYLKKGILDLWLKNYTRDQIAEAMIKVRGIWSELFQILGGCQSRGPIDGSN